MSEENFLSHETEQEAFKLASEKEAKKVVDSFDFEKTIIDRQRIEKSMISLTKREKNIVFKYYIEGKTLEEIGNETPDEESGKPSISGPRVRQMLMRAEGKMRETDRDSSNLFFHRRTN